MNKIKRIISLACIAALMSQYAIIIYAVPAMALDGSNMEKYSSSDIMFYDGDECDRDGTSATGNDDVSIHAEDLPAVTIELLEAAGVKEKAQQNLEAYKAGAEIAGIPWQAFAALHYREAGMDPNRSMTNGEALDGGISADGVQKGTDLVSDAKHVASFVGNNPRYFYDLDITQNKTLEDWGKTFLAYNRGGLYTEGGIDWKLSPYPMNYLDEDHIRMSFPNVSKEYEPCAGMINEAVGALAVFIYLGGMEGSEEVSESSGSSDGSDVTWIGDSISVRADSYKLFTGKVEKADKYIQVSKVFGEADESSAGGKGGLTILKELAADKKIRSTLVYALGTNSPGMTTDDLEAVLEAAKSAQMIIFVTNYNKDDPNVYASNNNIFFDAEKNNDKVIVADWKEIAEKNPTELLGDDTVHPTEAGMKKWMEVITSKLNAKSSNTTEAKNSCPCDKKANVDVQGGLTMEQAQKMVDYFKDDSNDDKWTPSLRKWNCTSLSTWFVQMFTDVGGPAAANGGAKKGCLGCDNGGEVVASLEALGVETGTTPRPFAVFSVTSDMTPDISSGSAGHTGVVLAVNGDELIFIEAAWDHDGYAAVKTIDKNKMGNSRHTNLYAYLDSRIDADALAEAIGGEKITTSPTNGSEGVAESGVTWDDGWITSGLSGYYKDDAVQSNDSAHNGDFTTQTPKGTNGPNKILLHSTEGPISSDTMKGSDIYNGNYQNNSSYPPHFTIDMKRKRTYQHYPITKPSDSIAQHDDIAGVQIEIVGYSTEDKKDNDWYLLSNEKFGKSEWDYLAKLLAAISFETGIKLTSSVNWASPSRLSVEEFEKYTGVLGHMHAPDNDHVDPNNIWPMLSNSLGNLNVSTGKCPPYEKAWTGDFPYYDQCDERWKYAEYGPSCGDGITRGGASVCSGGCGPSSFAMMATALTGIEYTPDVVAKYAGDKGMHICGAGSSGALPETIADHFGLAYENKGTPGIEKISEYLKEGKMFWLCSTGDKPYTSGGHCIGVRGITKDGKWLIADSNGAGGGEANTLSTEWDPAKIYTNSNFRMIWKK